MDNPFFDYFVLQTLEIHSKFLPLNYRIFTFYVVYSTLLSKFLCNFAAGT